MSSNKSGAIDAHLGRQLRARRLHLRMKQAELAAALQVSIQQVHKYETAKSSLPAVSLIPLARVLGVEPAYFFNGLEAPDTVASPLLRIN
ncbi:MAG TPA: helix-turn-helix transcriptional regulator [Caulobacteraceae bacterium]|jgi:transcriptional regulator with XRE-family HTH domain